MPPLYQTMRSCVDVLTEDWLQIMSKLADCSVMIFRIDPGNKPKLGVIVYFDSEIINHFRVPIDGMMLQRIC